MSKTDLTKTGLPVLAETNATHPAQKCAKGKAPRIGVGKTAKGKPQIEITEGEDHARLLSTFATKEIAFATRLMGGLFTATGTADIQEQDCNELLAVVHGIGPRDEVEAMLAVQMTATHNAVMHAARQLKGSTQIVQQDSNSNLVNKLMRTFTAQVETLNRYRNAGQQQVVVKHVQVNAGQAVVGINMTEGVGADNGNQQ